MNDRMEDSRNDVICRCSGTTTQRILQLMEKGVTTLEDISSATGACSGCGACDTDIIALLNTRMAQGQL